MLPVTPIVRLLHGSHLYGTSTPDSDVDYKGVHLPSGKAIVLGEPEMVITRNTQPNRQVANTPDDIDDQSYSLAKFLGMLSTGDTVATEMIFAPADMIIGFSPVWEALQAHRHRLVNREISGFVSYCVQQADKYSLKGGRLATAEALVALLEDAVNANGRGLRLLDVRADLEAFASNPAHNSCLEEITGRHGLVEHLICLDRKIPIGTKVLDALAVYRRVCDAYGKRAAAVLTAGGVDWKAMSHALRVARQAEELLTTGQLTFPRPDAADLLAIKLGTRPYDAVKDELLDIVERLPSLASASSLPATSDAAWMQDFILEHHLAQVTRS